MPTDDRYRLDNEEHILPARPGRPQDCPEEPIQKAQLRPRPFPLQNGYLLAKGEDLYSDVRTALEEDARGSNQGEENWQHEPPVLTCPNDQQAQRRPRAASY